MKPFAMPIHTLRALLGGVLATALSAPALAFIDERSPPPPAPVPFQPGASNVPIPGAPLTLTPAQSVPPAAQAGAALSGSFAEMAWLAPMPAAGGAMPLSMAIMQAVPPAIGTVQLDGDSSAFGRQVTLPAGTSYHAALASAAQQAGVRIERYLKTFRVVDLAMGGAGTVAPQPAAGLTTLSLAEQPRAAVVPVIEPVRPAFAVTPEDGNVRRTVARWAKSAGWTFEPEHWKVQVDIPLTASATFSSDFKESVQDLLSSTELGDTPVHGCFYTNKVVRVVPYTESCDRTAAR